jgi:hypothetical protein
VWAAENPEMHDASYSAKKRAKRPSTPKKVKQQRVDSKLAVAQVEKNAIYVELTKLRAQLATSEWPAVERMPARSPRSAKISEDPTSRQPEKTLAGGSKQPAADSPTKAHARCKITEKAVAALSVVPARVEKAAAVPVCDEEADVCDKCVHAVILDRCQQLWYNYKKPP